MCVHVLVHACRFAIVCTGVCALGVAQKHGNALLNRFCSGPRKSSVSHGRAREWRQEDTTRKGGKERWRLWTPSLSVPFLGTPPLCDVTVTFSGICSVL